MTDNSPPHNRPASADAARAAVAPQGEIRLAEQIKENNHEQKR
jgi:hypothetical protein